MRCAWCEISRDYYVSDEHASRQNCGVSDSGYHTWVVFPCIYRLFNRRSKTHDSLLKHRRESRRHTI